MYFTLFTLSAQQTSQAQHTYSLNLYKNNYAMCLPSAAPASCLPFVRIEFRASWR